MKQQQDHWLVRPRTIKILWIMFSVVLALLVGADFFCRASSAFWRGWPTELFSSFRLYILRDFGVWSQSLGPAVEKTRRLL